MKIKDAYIGENKIARAYQGGDIIHPSPVMDGLVLWYDFMGRTNSDAQRAVAEDLSGNGNHGELVNFAFEEGSGYVEGYGNSGGVNFDGVDDLVFIGNPPTLENIQSMSLELTFTTGSISTWQRLIDKNWSFFSLALWSDDRLNVNIGGLASPNNFSVRNLKKNTQYHVVATFDFASQTLSLFINAKADFIRDAPGRLNYSRVNLIIGAMNPAAQVFAGRISSARIYNRALTEQEIQHNFEMEKERWGI
ncbi:LamG domain-containing protein [Planomicrobium sp. YIM 101495]|uniref:LamG domain-containing protein n=1 Tax=Planomicrobium sp. YIM 101495 TaxID=2665160 RepID=UPI0012B72B76|nr:LamG domain-containing protein [Planomicrobium sp. YIM 101495]MTD30151.1 hypothetical protein [Planomicrobium sp. YIM 101495]